MKKNSQLDKIVADLIEANKYLDLKLAEAQDTLDSSEEDSDEEMEAQNDVEALEEIVEHLGNVIDELQASID